MPVCLVNWPGKVLSVGSDTVFTREFALARLTEEIERHLNKVFWYALETAPVARPSGVNRLLMAVVESFSDPV